MEKKTVTMNHWKGGLYSIPMKMLLLILFFASLISFQYPSEVRYKFSWWTHNNGDGTPSKCDCDYRGEDITLYTDSTCVFREQRGRLDPKFSTYKGYWSIQDNHRLLLRFTEYQSFFDEVPVAT
jgi:hypothetical protein